MKKTRSTQPGFTLIELIVSIAIVSLMLFLIDRIFFDTTNAVSRGVSISKMIANARAIGEQIDQDATSPATGMVGPGGKGFLIILNKRYATVPIRDKRQGSTFSTADIRSDQLCFIRKVATLDPIAPGSTTSFANTSSATYGRVWYGHLLMTDDDGTGPTTGPLGATTGGRDQFGSDWSLGRQLLFFDGAVDAANIRADFASTNWPVSGYGGTAHNFYMGETDILNTFLDSTLEGTNSGTGSAGAGLEIIDSLASLTRSQYWTAIQKFVFLDERLRANPFPLGTDFTSLKIAQMHAYFASHVSDFIVQFAGDYQSPTDGKIDTTGGSIIWYDRDTPPPAGGTNVFNPTAATTEPYYFSGMTNSCADTAFVWRHDDTTHWPYLIRIRYRLHDAKGELLGYNDAAGKAEPGKWFEIILKVNRN